MYKIYLLAACFFLGQVHAQSPIFVQNGVTIAGGNGQGPAANQFNEPNNIVIDASGNLIVADLNNHRIQKWAPGALQGVTILGGNGPDSSPTQFDHPTDIRFDAAGNTYVCDASNARVLRFPPGSTVGVTVAGGNGTGSASYQLNYPSGIFVDAAQNVFVADYYNNRIQKWALGAVTGVTVAGGNGSGSAANQLVLPNDVFVDSKGNIYVPDQNNHRVQKFLPGSTTGITVAGGNGNGAGANQFSFPTAVVVDDFENIYVADFWNHRVQRWSPGATTGVTVAGGNGQGSAPNQFYSPVNLTFDAAGNLVVSDVYNHRVQRFNQAFTCPPNTVIQAASCSGKTVVRWMEPKDSFPPIIKLPSYLDPATGGLSYLGSFNGHGYYQSSGVYTWPDAKDISEYLGDTGVQAHLATITSAAENAFLTNFINGPSLYPWIGLYNTGKPGSFRWVSGETVSYANWAAGEPSNFLGNAANLAEPFVHLYPSGQWNDQRAYLLPFIMEIDKPVIHYRQVSGVSNGSEQSPGIYMICYETTNMITGIKDTCCFSVTIQCAPGLSAPAATTTTRSELNAAADGISVKAFPNPTSTEFTLNLSSSNREKISVQISDITGKIVETRNGLAPYQQIRTGSNLKPGVYFIEVKQGARKVQLKMVKQ